jgi:hypothetical protein
MASLFVSKNNYKSAWTTPTVKVTLNNHSTNDYNKNKYDFSAIKEDSNEEINLSNGLPDCDEVKEMKSKSVKRHILNSFNQGPYQTETNTRNKSEVVFGHSYDWENEDLK